MTPLGKLASLILLGAGAAAAAASDNQLAAASGDATSMIRQMAGTWKVQQRMWPAPGAQPLVLPAAIARRQVLAGGFLQEEMKATSGKAPDAFTRLAYFNYNPVSQQYEYFSIDSRAPQMMNERGQAQDQKGLSLDGTTFSAPRWGEMSNTSFHYRLLVGAVENDRQLVQLYLTPQSPAGSGEFLAFEYVYTRQR